MFSKNMPENTVSQTNQPTQAQTIPDQVQPQVVQYAQQPKKNNSKKIVGIVAFVTLIMCCCICVVASFAVTSSSSFQTNFKSGFEKGLNEKGMTLEEYCEEENMPFRSAVCE